jgi:hypothetical protein
VDLCDSDDDIVELMVMPMCSGSHMRDGITLVMVLNNLTCVME